MSKEKSKYQKVLDLLNEYEDPMVSRYEEYDEETGFFILNNWQKAYEEVIVGKAYWFIEWLVENEKLKWTDKMEKRKLMLWMPEKQDYYIMMLAVTPQPINFLISILK